MSTAPWPVQMLVRFGTLALFSFALANTATPAEASGPKVYGSCAEAYHAPRSEGAKTCRKAGWFVSGRLVVSAKKRVRMVDLPACDQEDGSGQRACVWFAGERGNGRGHSFAKMPRAGIVYFRDGHKADRDNHQRAV
jgi:hypothetical protein